MKDLRCPNCGAYYPDTYLFCDRCGTSLRPPIPSEEPRSLRDWWHQTLREHGRYSCYAFFLTLPADKEAIRYLSEFGEELDLISERKCLVIGLSNSQSFGIGYDSETWSSGIKEQASKGYSITIANLFKISFTEFPCMILFDDIRSSDHILVSLRGMTAEEIVKNMRGIFSIVREAISNQKNPIQAIEALKKSELLVSKSKIVVSDIRNFAGKTFEKAMEAWIQSIIK